MSKTILLIENDAPFAAEMSGALEAMGYQVRVTGDGKEGFDLARELRPDAIVLCVELPKLSGYSICNKLKKDDALRAIPLILTSSEATDEVFEDHRKLKVRAEEYLIKPYVSASLLEKLAAHLGGAGAGPAAAHPPAEPVEHAGEEEVVSLEEETGHDPFAGEPGGELPALDLDSLPDEPVAASPGDSGLDDDLRLLDDAFDGLATPGEAPPSPTRSRDQGARAPRTGEETRAADEALEKAMGVDRPVTSEDLEAASASLPDEDETEARAELDGLHDETDLALGALGDLPAGRAPSALDELDELDALAGLDEPASAPSAVPAPPPAIGASGAGAAELARLEAELAERRSALRARDSELNELKAKLQSATRRADQAESSLGAREAEASTLKAQVRKSEADAKIARDESRRTTEQVRELEARVAAADGRCRTAEQDAASQRRAAEQANAELLTARAAADRLAEVERELERLETELVVARGEVDGARSEVDKRSGDLKRRVSELETANAKNEERVVKAYLKIKGDEKVRDKARKALAIALQLLDEGLPSDSSSDKRSHHPGPE